MVEFSKRPSFISTQIRNATLENCHCSSIYIAINHNLTLSVFVIKHYFVQFQ